MKRGALIITFLFIFSTATYAQIKKAGLSPRTKVEQQVGLAKITLDYGKPGAKDRPIFGALIPYDKVWRTGANSSTKINFSDEVSLNNNKIPAGSYALYSIPGAKEWTIIIHKNTKLWGAGGYNANDDFIRFKVPVINLKDKQETLDINFENFNANGGTMTIKWENTKIEIPVFVDSDKLVFKEIEDKLINAKGEVSAATYFDAAQFYYEKNKDLQTASKWFDKAIELRPSAFWYIYYKAELAYHLKDFKTAETFAKKSLELAKSSKAGDYGYIAKCDLLLSKLQKS